MTVKDETEKANDIAKKWSADIKLGSQVDAFKYVIASLDIAAYIMSAIHCNKEEVLTYANNFLKDRTEYFEKAISEKAF